jgi:ACT domain-containing protein
MKFSREKTLVAYMKKGCNVSATCSAVGISRQTFYQYRKDDKVFHQALIDAEEAIIDNVESKLLSKINEGDTTLIIFFLKTKAKSRGYVERQEVDMDVQGDMNLTVQFIE